MCSKCASVTIQPDDTMMFGCGSPSESGDDTCSEVTDWPGKVSGQTSATKCLCEGEQCNVGSRIQCLDSDTASLEDCYPGVELCYKCPLI